MYKKILIVTATLLILVGCATPPQNAYYQHQAQNQYYNEANSYANQSRQWNQQQTNDARYRSQQVQNYSNTYHKQY